MSVVMNKDMDDNLDASLLLLSGSEITRQGIEAIAEISTFDPFIIQQETSQPDVAADVFSVVQNKRVGGSYYAGCIKKAPC